MKKRIYKDRILTNTEKQKRFRQSNELMIQWYERMTGIRRKKVKQWIRESEEKNAEKIQDDKRQEQKVISPDSPTGTYEPA